MSATHPPSMPAASGFRPYAKRVSVLPFENLGGTPEDERLARGFWHDVITELARFPALGVVAARSSSAVQTRAAAGALVAVQPGIDYLVSGSVRRAGPVIRVAAQLFDAQSGQQLWADRYDRPGEEVFCIQDEITARVANALNARIDQQHLAAARRRSLAALEAYEIWLRGFECLQQGTLEADAEARTMFERALEIDPEFARGYAGISLSYFNEWSCNAWDRWGETERQAYAYARRAEALDPNDQVMQIILGRIEQYRRRFDAAQHHFQRALALAPNDAQSLLQLGLYFAYQGDVTLAVSVVERGLDLNPLCPAWHIPYAAVTQFIARDYPRALQLGERAPSHLMVDLPAYYGAACAYLGQSTRARAFVDDFDRQFVERIARGRDLDPDEQLQWVRHVNPFRHEAEAEHFLEGLRRARGAGTVTVAAAPGDAEPLARVDGEEPPGIVLARSPRLRPWPVANMFRREGAYWTLCYEQHAVQLPELKGFRDLAHLLGQPGEEVHCMSLAGRDEEGGGGRGGAVLDERARREYQRRLAELRAEVDAATEANDPGRAALAQEELDALVQELARVTGLGGRTRKLGDPAERARSAVTWRIRNAVKKVSAVHPALGRHLANAIQTGVFCRYQPERPTEWEV